MIRGYWEGKPVAALITASQAAAQSMALTRVAELRNAATLDLAVLRAEITQKIVAGDDISNGSVSAVNWPATRVEVDAHEVACCDLDDISICSLVENMVMGFHTPSLGSGIS